MKIIAQGDPIEYDVAHAADACRLYRDDMTKALIGVVTHVTDYERAQRQAESIRLLNGSYQELHAAYEHIVKSRDAATKEVMRLETRLREIYDHPDASQGIRSIIEAVIGL